MTTPHDDRTELRLADARVTRRSLIQGSGAAAAGAAVTGALTHAQDAATPSATPGASPAASPAASNTVPEPGPPAIKFFNPTESMIVEALTARIMPGTKDDPGAREAGVVYYIDNTLSGVHEGLALKTYTQGPYLEVSENETPVESSSRTDIYRTVPVTSELASRYGYQSALSPQDLYRRGCLSVVAHVKATYNTTFDKLTEAQHDEIVQAMVDDKVTGFDAPDGPAFFQKLRNDTIEGMFSDPIYGGNRDMVGWKLLRYPGARGFYTFKDMANSDFHADPVSLGTQGAGHMDMHH